MSVKSWEQVCTDSRKCAPLPDGNVNAPDARRRQLEFPGIGMGKVYKTKGFLLLKMPNCPGKPGMLH